MVSAAVAPLSRASDMFLQDLEREVASARRERRGRRLATGLMSQLCIAPHGIDLVCWLGNPPCCSNADALVGWIVRQLADPDCERDLADQPEYEVLLKRLNRFLSCMEAANS